MKLKSTLLLITLSLSWGSLHAQKSLSGFSKLTPEQLSITEVPFEKEAQAVILDEEGFLDLSEGGYQRITKRRIKILDEQAIDVGNISIAYYAKDKLQLVSNIKAQSINLVNGEYVSTPIEDKDIYTVDVNSHYKAIRFAVPNVRVGTIIEYQYILSSQPLYKIDAWEFQHDYPTLESKLKIKTSYTSGYGKLFMGKNLLTKYKNKIEADTWSLSNIPSSKAFQYALNPKNQVESILLQSSNLRHWGDLKKEIKDIYFLTENSAAVKSYTHTIPNGANDQETLDLVVKHFTNYFRWNKIYGIWASKEQKDIINDRLGNQAELNLLFSKILQQKGINADLVLLSSRTNGKVMTKYPFLQQFDNVVNKVTLKDGSVYLINAVDIPQNTYKYAPLYLFNDYGFVLDQNNVENFVQLNQFLSQHDVDIKYAIKEGKIKEVRKDILSGYFYDDDVKETKQLTSATIKSPIPINNDEKGNPLLYIDGKYVVTHQSETAFSTLGKIITLENPLEKLIHSFTFDEVDRIYPIEFDFPYYYKVLVTTEIPEGFEVLVSNDFNQTVRSHDKLIYGQTFAQKGNVLQVMYEFYLGKATFPASDYGLLKEHFNKIKTEGSKQITLKKIN